VVGQRRQDLKLAGAILFSTFLIL